MNIIFNECVEKWKKDCKIVVEDYVATDMLKGAIGIHEELNKMYKESAYDLLNALTSFDIIDYDSFDDYSLIIYNTYSEINKSLERARKTK